MYVRIHFGSSLMASAQNCQTTPHVATALLDLNRFQAAVSSEADRHFAPIGVAWKPSVLARVSVEPRRVISFEVELTPKVSLCLPVDPGTCLCRRHSYLQDGDSGEERLDLPHVRVGKLA